MANSKSVNQKAASKSPAKIPAPAAAKKEQAPEKRWSKQVIDLGWTAIPNLLLDRQQVLGLDPIDLNILLVLLKHWWEPKKYPYPSKKVIAESIGRAEGTVQRHVRKMESDGLIKRNNRYYASGGQSSNIYDLSGLIEKLKPLAVEEAKTRQRRKDEDGRKRRGNTKVAP